MYTFAQWNLNVTFRELHFKGINISDFLSLHLTFFELSKLEYRRLSATYNLNLGCTAMVIQKKLIYLEFSWICHFRHVNKKTKRTVTLKLYLSESLFNISIHYLSSLFNVRQCHMNWCINSLTAIFFTHCPQFEVHFIPFLLCTKIKSIVPIHWVVRKERKCVKNS